MEARGYSIPDVVARTVKAVGHASVFYLLALPLVAFSTCGGPSEQFTGYQALRGIPFSPSEWNLDPSQFSGFGHDWWVAGILVVALLGMASAVWGGVRGAFAGLGITIAGFVCVGQAIAFFSPPPEGYQWSPEAASGGNDILFVYLGLVLTELAWLTGKSWSVLGRSRGTELRNRSRWVALGVFSTGFLTLIGFAVLAGAAIVVAYTRS
jgi:hypothetical protein